LITSGYERDDGLAEAEEAEETFLHLQDEWLTPAEIAIRNQLREKRFARKRMVREEAEAEPIRTPTVPVLTPQPVRQVVPVQKEIWDQ
jgi:hypothetical protein